ncbi:MAG: hypothetical protein AAF725_26145 [Acidobacteriota bacterium]
MPALAAAPARAEGGATATDLEIAVLNGVYTELDPGLAPIRQGPITLWIRSPEHELRVLSNRLTLRPTEDGLLEAALEAEVEGWGQLVVDLQTAAGTSALEDRVEAPRQLLEVAGTVRMVRAPGGYLVSFLSFEEPSMGVEIESRLAGQLGDACRTLAALGLGVLDCDSLLASLRRIEVPLPEPGTEFLVRRELLSAEERAVFDRLAGDPEEEPG